VIPPTFAVAFASHGQKPGGEGGPAPELAVGNRGSRSGGNRMFADNRAVNIAVKGGGEGGRSHNAYGNGAGLGRFAVAFRGGGKKGKISSLKAGESS